MSGSYFNSLNTVNIDLNSGWIEGVRQRESPNCDARPRDCQLDLIVVHGISLPPGEFGGPWIDRFFANELSAIEHPYFETIIDLHVSAHVLIGRDGALTQYVSFRDRAWHAGESEYCGRSCCNDFSIGIELEGADDVPYDQAQYESLAMLIGALKHCYQSLRLAEIVGHCDIASGRKTDPGPAFDWSRLTSLLEGVEA